MSGQCQVDEVDEVDEDVRESRANQDRNLDGGRSALRSALRSACVRSLASPFHSNHRCPGIHGIPGPELGTDMWLLQSRPSIPPVALAVSSCTSSCTSYMILTKYQGKCAKCVLTFPCSIPMSFQGRRVCHDGMFNVCRSISRVRQVCVSNAVKDVHVQSFTFCCLKLLNFSKDAKGFHVRKGRRDTSGLTSVMSTSLTASASQASPASQWDSKMS